MTYIPLENIEKRSKLTTFLLGANFIISSFVLSGMLYFVIFIGGEKFQNTFKNITKLIEKGCKEFSC